VWHMLGLLNKRWVNGEERYLNSSALIDYRLRRRKQDFNLPYVQAFNNPHKHSTIHTMATATPVLQHKWQRQDIALALGPNWVPIHPKKTSLNGAHLWLKVVLNSGHIVSCKWYIQVFAYSKKHFTHPFWWVGRRRWLQLVSRHSIIYGVALSKIWPTRPRLGGCGTACGLLYGLTTKLCTTNLRRIGASSCLGNLELANHTQKMQFMDMQFMGRNPQPYKGGIVPLPFSKNTSHTPSGEWVEGGGLQLVLQDSNKHHNCAHMLSSSHSSPFLPFILHNHGQETWIPAKNQ